MFSNERGFELYESSITVKPAAKSKTSPRIFGGCAVFNAAAISSAGFEKRLFRLPTPPARYSSCDDHSSEATRGLTQRRSQTKLIRPSELVSISTAETVRHVVDTKRQRAAAVLVAHLHHELIVSVENRRAFRFQSFDQLRLRGRDVFDRAEISR
jgi:hypothetical protein